MAAKTWPVVLTVAGSDNSGGAGIQADLKTFSALRVYGTTAITCVVAEHPGRVGSIHALPPALVEEQMEMVAEAFPLAAAKTGMLFSRSIIRRVAQFFARHNLQPVVDPVMVAGSGGRLLAADAEKALAEEMFPQAAIVTPNLAEASVLLGRTIRGLAEARRAGLTLAKRWGCPFLIKGGHRAAAQCIDVLAFPDGSLQEFSSPRVARVKAHGTGCTTSAAICALLARGRSLSSAVTGAKRFITRTLAGHRPCGAFDLLDHFHS